MNNGIIYIVKTSESNDIFIGATLGPIDKILNDHKYMSDNYGKSKEFTNYINKYDIYAIKMHKQFICKNVKHLIQETYEESFKLSNELYINNDVLINCDCGASFKRIDMIKHFNSVVHIEYETLFNNKYI